MNGSTSTGGWSCCIGWMPPRLKGGGLLNWGGPNELVCPPALEAHTSMDPGSLVPVSLESPILNGGGRPVDEGGRRDESNPGEVRA